MHKQITRDLTISGLFAGVFSLAHNVLYILMLISLTCTQSICLGSQTTPNGGCETGELVSERFVDAGDL